jgi:uncharacterized damage-inducible protein DinB
MTSDRSLLTSIEAEFRLYKTLGDGAMRQLTGAQLSQAPGDGSSSITTIIWHIAGNLESRFTDFLTSDGEKPWRDRDDEFVAREQAAEAVQEKWANGWRVLEEALASLTDADLSRTVTIRHQELPIHQALHRALAHTSYHAGQVVYLAKWMRGTDWTTLSIPVGGSKAFNEHMARRRG